MEHLILLAYASRRIQQPQLLVVQRKDIRLVLSPTPAESYLFMSFSVQRRVQLYLWHLVWCDREWSDPRDRVSTHPSVVQFCCNSLTQLHLRGRCHDDIYFVVFHDHIKLIATSTKRKRRLQGKKDPSQYRRPTKFWKEYTNWNFIVANSGDNFEVQKMDVPVEFGSVVSFS